MALPIVLLLVTAHWTVSSSTWYCPLTHQIDPSHLCNVQYRSAGRVLVKHVDLSAGTVQISVHEEGSTRWVALPPRASNVCSRAARLELERDGRSLRFNGMRFNMHPVSKSYVKHCAVGWGG